MECINVWMSRLSKWAHVNIMDCSHRRKDVGVETQPAAGSYCCLRSSECYITWKLSVSPVSKASTKTCDDTFLAGHGCALFQAAEATNLQRYWICDQKTDGFFDLQSKINCIFGCAESTQNACIVLPEIVPTMSVDKGMLFQQALCNSSQQTSNIDFASCGGQTPVELWQEAGSSPIRLTAL